MNDLVSHEEIITTITRLIDAGKLPHLLLYGPPGTGKTSTILACARRMYGKRFASMVLELNASDDRGIDVVREQIKEFASTRQMFTSAPKLIILDLSLPRIDGWTVAKSIRSSPTEALTKVPIIAVTAHAMKGDRQRALEAGCDEYLSKPISPRELARKVTAVLRAHSS